MYRFRSHFSPFWKYRNFGQDFFLAFLGIALTETPICDWGNEGYVGFPAINLGPPVSCWKRPTFKAFFFLL